ncbi:hypothetical protein CEE44_01565 [Candidatus Woesearchaeota archaeon B3_Woes]|nr:MAG: hypothetical protein CEE44_01565 [Candidatus Woesearchaeota archaeon B3_Woes]
MNNKEVLSLGFVLVLLIALIAVFPSVDSSNQIVAFATLNTEQITIDEYGKVDIITDGGSYILSLYDLTKDRKRAKFSLKSNPFSSNTDYFQQYFALDFDVRTISFFGNPLPIRVQPQKSKTLYLGDEQLYIELISIKNKQANIIIRKG